MTRYLSLFAFSLLVFAAVPAHAAGTRYNFDRLHTQILFFADHLGFSSSSGRFLDFDGHFDFDQGHPADSDVEITIKTDSLDMADGNWDEHLKGPDFFNVAKYPDMMFKSTAIKVTGEKTADITGDLTMLGQTHPVTLHTTLNKVGLFPINNQHRAGFSATAMLDRTQWGMTAFTPMMNPMTEIRIQVEGTPADEAEEGTGNK